MLAHMKDRINRGDYGLIIGDDASGRIPALIFDKVLKKIYSERNFNSPQTIFLAGSSGLSQEKVEEKTKKLLNYFEKELVNMLGSEKMELLKSKKILIVTDTIYSGRGLKPLTDVLKDNGFNFDIATIGFFPFDYNYDESLRKLKGILGGNIFYGTTGTPDIYNKKNISGVVKEAEEVLSIPVRTVTEISEQGKKIVQKNTAASRQDVNKITTEIFDWYRSNF